MKAKKGFRFLAMLILVIASTETHALAEMKAYICDVASVGTNLGKTSVSLTHVEEPPEFPDLSWFVADPLANDQMLIIGLTAMVKGMRVRVHTDLDIKDPQTNKPLMRALIIVN